MTDTRLVLALEERTFNAWPALQTVHVDGWLLRTALGHTKRANAASALHPQHGMGADDFVALVENHYRRHGIAPMVRITPLTPQEHEAAFRKAGWTEFDRTDVLTLPLTTPLPHDEVAAVVMEERPNAGWITGAAEAYDLRDWQGAALGAIVGNIRVPARFITMHLDGRAVGYGLGVCERGFVGLYDLAITADARSKGIGRQMVAALLHWGRAEGANIGYLQVRQENSGAQRLYRAMGFADVYSYYCLRPR